MKIAMFLIAACTMAMAVRADEKPDNCAAEGVILAKIATMRDTKTPYVKIEYAAHDAAFHSSVSPTFSLELTNWVAQIFGNEKFQLPPGVLQSNYTKKCLSLGHRSPSPSEMIHADDR